MLFLEGTPVTIIERLRAAGATDAVIIIVLEELAERKEKERRRKDLRNARQQRWRKKASTETSTVASTKASTVASTVASTEASTEASPSPAYARARDITNNPSVPSDLPQSKNMPSGPITDGREYTDVLWWPSEGDLKAIDERFRRKSHAPQFVIWKEKRIANDTAAFIQYYGPGGERPMKMTPQQRSRLWREWMTRSGLKDDPGELKGWGASGPPKED